MQNCVKKARSSLTWCIQPEAVVRSTVRAITKELVQAMFDQPLAESNGVVLAARHDGPRCQDSQNVLQQVEECSGVVKAVHEQHVVLVGDLRVLHETAENTVG